MKPIKIYHNLQFDYFHNIAISIGAFETRERKHLAARRCTKVEKFSYTAGARFPFKLRDAKLTMPSFAVGIDGSVLRNCGGHGGLSLNTSAQFRVPHCYCGLRSLHVVTPLENAFFSPSMPLLVWCIVFRMPTGA